MVPLQHMLTNATSSTILALIALPPVLADAGPSTPLALTALPPTATREFEDVYLDLEDFSRGWLSAGPCSFLASPAEWRQLYLAYSHYASHPRASIAVPQCTASFILTHSDWPVCALTHSLWLAGQPPWPDCHHDTSVCPTFMSMQNVQRLQVWAEAVPSTFEVEIQSIRATSCYQPSTAAAGLGV